jgi:hypothetical protein
MEIVGLETTDKDKDNDNNADKGLVERPGKQDYCIGIDRQLRKYVD